MFRNQMSTPDHKVPIPGTMELPEVLRIVTDSFTSATERHIEVGDGLEMFVVRLPPGQAATAAPSSGATAGDVPMEGSAGAAAPAPTVGAAAIDLSAAPFHAVEALGGEDEQEEKAVMIIRRELKKD